jgi:hypothetical protein
MRAAHCAVAAWLLLAGGTAIAQVSNSENLGLPTNASFDGTGIENVQVNNGNLHIDLPLFSLPGRGLPVQVSYVYDSKGWWGYIPGDLTPTYVKPAPSSMGGASTQLWRVSAPLEERSGVLAKIAGKCGTTGSYLIYSFQESNGTTHSFPPVGCNNVSGNMIYAQDGSGYAYNLSTGKIITKAGVTNYYQTFQNTQLNVDVLEDANGNQITRGDSSQLGLASTVTDTLGRSVSMTFVLNSSTGKYELPYYDSNGNQQKIVMTRSPVTIVTHLCGIWNFGDGCHEYTGTWQMPTEIDLPNGMKYLISYNQNSYGTPSSIQLPTGATITYSYGSSTPDTCGTPGTTFDYDDAGPRVTSRTITNGSQVATWNYSYVCGTSSSSAYNDQTVVTTPPTATSPAGDDVVHSFTSFNDF